MYSVHSFAQPGMPARAIVASLEDARAVAPGLGIELRDLHTEALIEPGAVVAVAMGMNGEALRRHAVTVLCRPAVNSDIGDTDTDTEAA